MNATTRRIAAAALRARERLAGGLDFRKAIEAALSQAATALRSESEDRRLFLWIAPAMGAGAAVYFSLGREPSLAAAGAVFALAAACALGAWATGGRHAPALACAALSCGFFCAGLRTRLVEAPALDRIAIVSLAGYVEELDPRPGGARLLLRVSAADGLDPARVPIRVRLTARGPQRIRAGDFVGLKARLLPPPRAAAPGGYDFARDAFFARIGAVGNVLGVIAAARPPAPAPLSLRMYAAIDRARNALARRIASSLSGPAAAVAVAMVTGKRDFLDEPTKELIRQAGIFHIITISGAQMTLVAGTAFWCARRLFSLSARLALRRPIKAWAALIAAPVTILYDLATGSRIGAQRALIMTLVMLGAVVCGRRAFSMRNLAIAAAVVIVLEPEALLGASFQLSFAAVTALIAVHERRRAARIRRAFEASLFDRRDRLVTWLRKLRAGPVGLLVATACASAATASFMAYDFHEISPYVLIGNPLTFAVIEFFAVPGALLGSALYPLGLDAPVWRYLGAGVDLILWAATKIAAAPASSIPLVAFAAWPLVFLTAGLLSLAIWRSPRLRATAAPLLLIGLCGAAETSKRYAVEVAPSGQTIAVRAADGRLVVVGRRPDLFLVQQWLSADGDPRPPAQALAFGRGAPVAGVRCDKIGCVALRPEAAVALVLEDRGFREDCARADVLVTPLVAPRGCGARLVLDRDRLARTGAVALNFEDDLIETRTARTPGEDRPWSRAPARFKRDRPRRSP